jgi:LysR family glycine cleavage system transcriptional activator
MNRKLPPLNALRAFEAAARHLSISKAADELNVTPAAVSHQVKALEDVLGVQLFRRLNRAMMLTDAGQLFLPGLRDGFDRLAQAVEKVGAQCEGGTLTVSIGPSFAAKWLVPRLDRFRAAHPDIDLRIDATDRVANFARENVDVAIRYGPGRYPGLRVDRLFADEVFPVCSLELCDGPSPLREPGDLRHHTLLHVDWRIQDETSPNWRMWLLAAGVAGVEPTRGPKFSQESMVVQAAIEGHGVALTSSVLVADDLAAGRLCKPFTLSLPNRFAYYVVAPEAAADRPKVAEFRAWILAEAKPESGSPPT